MELTQEQLKELFDYHNDGYLLWKKITTKSSKRISIGSVAGSRWKNKYIKITINNKKYEAHRLIWIWHNGKFNKTQIDHIDGNGLNNKIQNLREANHDENGRNHKLYSTNKSGVSGVRFCCERKKWCAYITVNKKLKNLGRYELFQDAVNIRKQAEKKYFGQFLRENTNGPED